MLLVPSTARANLAYPYASSRVSRPPVSTPTRLPGLAATTASGASGSIGGFIAAWRPRTATSMASGQDAGRSTEVPSASTSRTRGRVSRSAPRP